MCRFDRNEFGQFLGSATVTFERPDDAKRAVHEYNGAYLDDKVLTVEFDMVPSTTHVMKPQPANSPRSGPVVKHPRGKTLRLKNDSH